MDRKVSREKVVGEWKVVPESFSFTETSMMFYFIASRLKDHKTIRDSEYSVSLRSNTNGSVSAGVFR
jgi:hypothetical protein